MRSAAGVREDVLHPVRPPAAAPRPSFLSDAVTTTAVQVLTATLNAASLAIIARRLGEFNLGLYTLERRGCALIQPLVLLGVTVATPRYIALALGRRSGTTASYAVTGVLLVGGAAAAVACVMVVFAEQVAAVVFGNRDAVGLAHALAGFVVAAALYQVAYSVFRGHLRMRRANALELITVGLAPAVLAAVGPTDVVALMWALTGTMLAATALSLVPRRPWRLPRLHARVPVSRARAGELLRFGLARTPGDFAVIAPFAIAPVAVVHFADPAQAGQTSVVLSTLGLVSIAAAPLGVLVLPHVALAVGRDSDPGPLWTRLAEATLDLAIGLAALLFLASELIVAIWLADAPAEAVAAQRVVALGVPGYVFYMIFRSYLDAIDVRPLSSVATMTGFVVLAAALPLFLLAPLASAPVAACAAVSAAVTAMGGVTWWLVRTRLSEIPSAAAFAPQLAAAIVIVAAGLALRDAGPGALAAATAAGALGYAALLVARRRAWLAPLIAQLGARAARVRWS
jgi:O-antigen/teichoic acid export membrane protein